MAILAAQANYRTERDVTAAIVNGARQLAQEWTAPLRDIAAWDDHTLATIGVRRDTILRAAEAEEDLRELREHLTATEAELRPKQRLAARISEWIERNRRGVAA